jgi:hypothetical protein
MEKKIEEVRTNAGNWVGKEECEEEGRKKGGREFERNRKITIEKENHVKKSLFECFATSRPSLFHAARSEVS